MINALKKMTDYSERVMVPGGENMYILWVVGEVFMLRSHDIRCSCDMLPGCLALLNTLIKSEPFPVRKLASLPSFAAQECGPGPTNQAQSCKTSTWKMKLERFNFLLEEDLQDEERNVPDFDFPVVSRPEAELLEPSPYFCRLCL